MVDWKEKINKIHEFVFSFLLRGFRYHVLIKGEKDCICISSILKVSIIYTPIYILGWRFAFPPYRWSWGFDDTISVRNGQWTGYCLPNQTEPWLIVGTYSFLVVIGGIIYSLWSIKVNILYYAFFFMETW